MALSVRLRPVRPCYVCGKREGDLTVSFEGRLHDVCEACIERGREGEMTEGTFEDDLDFEGDPTRNGAFG